MTPRGKAAVAFLRLPDINDRASLHDALMCILAMFKDDLKAAHLETIRQAAERAWAEADATLAGLYTSKPSAGYDDPRGCSETLAAAALKGNYAPGIVVVGGIIAASFSSRTNARAAFVTVAEAL